MILFRGGYFNTILKDTLETYLEKLRKKIEPCKPA